MEKRERTGLSRDDQTDPSQSQRRFMLGVSSGSIAAPKEAPDMNDFTSASKALSLDLFYYGNGLVASILILPQRQTATRR